MFTLTLAPLEGDPQVVSAGEYRLTALGHEYHVMLLPCPHGYTACVYIEGEGWDSYGHAETEEQALGELLRWALPAASCLPLPERMAQ